MPGAVRFARASLSIAHLIHDDQGEGRKPAADAASSESRVQPDRRRVEPPTRAQPGHKPERDPEDEEEQAVGPQGTHSTDSGWVARRRCIGAAARSPHRLIVAPANPSLQGLSRDLQVSRSGPSGRLLGCARSTSATALAGQGDDVEDVEPHAGHDQAEPPVVAIQDKALEEVEESVLKHSDECCAEKRALPQEPQVGAHSASMAADGSSNVLEAAFEDMGGGAHDPHDTP